MKSITTDQLIVALRSIDCFQFEKFIAELLEQTYNVETQTTPGSADGDVDVIVQSDTYPDDCEGAPLFGSSRLTPLLGPVFGEWQHSLKRRIFTVFAEIPSPIGTVESPTHIFVR